jgi:hypothetical protein
VPKKTSAQLDKEIADALATRQYVRRKYATAWFHPDWNAWTIGYGTEGTTGGAQAFTTVGSEAEAKRVANAYNAEQDKYAEGRDRAVKKAQQARARFKEPSTSASWMEIGYGLGLTSRDVAAWKVVGRCARGHEIRQDPRDAGHAVDLGCDAELKRAGMRARAK